MKPTDDPRVDDCDDFVQRWDCEPAPWGSSFRVLEDEWDETVTPPLRIIKKMKLYAVSLDYSSPTTRA